MSSLIQYFESFLMLGLFIATHLVCSFLTLNCAIPVNYEAI